MERIIYNPGIGSADELVDAIIFTKDKETLSVSDLRTKFDWGWNKASKIMDCLEVLNIVEEFKGNNKQRLIIKNNNT